MSSVNVSPSDFSPAWWTRVLRFPLTQIVIAILMVGVTVNLTFGLARYFVPDKSMRIMWPALLAAALCFGVYCLYVRWFEKRAVAEFSRPRALREVFAGMMWGLFLISVVMGLLSLLGVYQVSGSNSWAVMIVPIAELVLIAVLEEIAFRGVLFRIIEKSLGTWLAIVLSSVLFAVAHLPNEGVSLLAVVSVTMAGALLAGAYMMTRRLWFPIGIHFAWNYCLSEVFSVAVSGHPAQGLFDGKVMGADWLTGGAFGVEASVVTPCVISIAAAYFILRAKRTDSFVRPFWKRNKYGTNLAK